MNDVAWRFRAIDVTKVYGNGRVRANDQITLEVLPQPQMPIDSFRVREPIELTGRIRGGYPPAIRWRARRADRGSRHRRMARSHGAEIHVRQLQAARA